MRGNDRHGIVIQERDRRLLEELAVMRVVDREQARIVGGFRSTTRVNTRLLALNRAGLLRRFFLGATAGGRKALYALSIQGAAVIGLPVRGPRRRNNEVLVADFFISHQLAVNQIYCALKYGTVPVPGISFGRWIPFSEPFARDLRLIPDGYFELKTPSGVMAAFLEVDLGHERLAVWKEKIRKYLQLAISSDCERRFGQSQFRVLVIANSERRLLSIRKVVRASTQKIFWFTTMESPLGGFFAPVWLRPEGDERQTLLAQIQ
jgi:Replication-relaxation